MDRREWLQRSAAFGFAAAIPIAAVELYRTMSSRKGGAEKKMTVDTPSPLPSPQGVIPVAFVISDGAVVIDFAGPWEVFQDVHNAQGVGMFHLYTVAETIKPVTASSGLKIVPDFTFANAPVPKIVVIPAQNGETPAMLDWIRKSAPTADLTMSVCQGANVLAKTGLLAGKEATTHHDAYKDFSKNFPDVHLRRGVRFIEAGNLASAGGLSSGIDLALRVVERYYGRDRAQQTADMMEYQSRGWLDPSLNAVYIKEEHPLCPVCMMDGEPQWKSLYQGKTYLFCSQAHKKQFDDSPNEYAS